MVYNGKPYEQMDDLGVPLFLETPIYTSWCIFLLKKFEVLWEVQPTFLSLPLPGVDGDGGNEKGKQPKQWPVDPGHVIYL